MRFAVLTEMSHEFKESWIWFLQFNGNEKELVDLGEKLLRTKQIYEGGYSTFRLATNTVDEDTALEMSEMRMGNRHPHKVIYGKMKFIPYQVSGTQQNDIYNLNLLLSEGKIEKLFDDRWTYC